MSVLKMGCWAFFTVKKMKIRFRFVKNEKRGQKSFCLRFEGFRDKNLVIEKLEFHYPGCVLRDPFTNDEIETTRRLAYINDIDEQKKILKISDSDKKIDLTEISGDKLFMGFENFEKNDIIEFS